MLKSMKKKLNETKGFTLIEVIVVLVIIAILMAIAVPNVLGYINRAKGTEAQATARSIYMAATAESAEILKSKDTMDKAAFDADNHIQNVKELANFDGDIDTVGYSGGSITAPGAGDATLLIADNVIAGVAYTPASNDGSNTKDVVVYNGYTGNITVGDLDGIEKTETTTNS